MIKTGDEFDGWFRGQDLPQAERRLHQMQVMIMALVKANGGKVVILRSVLESVQEGGAIRATEDRFGHITMELVK